MMLQMILSIVLILVLIAVQAMLAKRPRLWPGLLLPGASFLYSLVAAWYTYANSLPEEALPMAFAVIFMSNIPTVFFLIIFLKLRHDGKNKDESQKDAFITEASGISNDAPPPLTDEPPEDD